MVSFNVILISSTGNLAHRGLTWCDKLLILSFCSTSVKEKKRYSLFMGAVYLACVIKITDFLSKADYNYSCFFLNHQHLSFFDRFFTMKTIQFGPPVATATPNNFRIDLPTDRGQGSFSVDCFASGLKLSVMRTAFTEPQRIQNVATGSTIGFGFCLAGQIEGQIACVGAPFTINAGDSGFFAFPKMAEMNEVVSRGEVLRISLLLEGDSLAMLAHGDEDRFLPILNSLDHRNACRIGDTTTPVMKAILQQLLHCPYCGATRQLFIEGKAMELLAHKLEQLHPCGHVHDCSAAVKMADKERVHHAAHILVNELENPPDMATLSRNVGLSRSKLHRCFHKVYGCSPFDYLRHQRLQTAMLLLQEGEVNVTEAALTVGYTNMSYFAKAFKATFGVAPGELLNPRQIAV